MKVALVHDYLLQYGGAEKVLLVLAEMFPDAPIYCLASGAEFVNKYLPGRDIRSSFITRLPFYRRHYKKYMPLFPVALEQFDFGDYDLVISSSSAFVKGILTPVGTTHVSYMYTPMRFAWELYQDYAGQGGIRSRGIYGKVLPFIMNYLRLWDQVSTDRIDHMICDSYHVARRIEKYYRREAEVIYPPVDVEEFTVSEEDDGYFLIVSRLIPYKRIDLAVEVFNELGLPLVIIGEGYDRKRLERMAGSNVTFLGFQPEGVVKEYYARCRAFIFPGEDDFGITPVEAMASGKPVIAYGRGGALETVVDGVTGLFFKEATAASLKEAVLRFDKMNFGPVKCRQRAEEFDTAIFKAKFMDFVDQVCRK